MYNDFWEYDPGSDSWMQKANYPGGPRLSPFGFAIGTKGYAGCGLDASLYGQPDFYEFNPATNTWTPKATFAGTPIFGATAVVWNNTALIMFGDDWAPNYYKHSEIYSYNAVTNAWNYVGVFPGDGRRDHVAFNINNKIYFGTGNDNTYTELNDWWEWDPGTGSMTQKPNFIGSPRSQAVGFDIGGKAYVGTGGVGDERDFFAYTPATNSWQGIDDFAGTGRENSMSFVIGERAYIIAGTSGINFHDCWEFDPAQVTGVNELSNAQDAISVYPNPATEKINIDLQNVNGEVSYHIYNVSGQLAIEGNISIWDSQLQIPVNQLAKGEYCIFIESAGTIRSTRFVKN
jgi:N-acetylneuraminic acid mutarotase